MCCLAAPVGSVLFEDRLDQAPNWESYAIIESNKFMQLHWKYGRALDLTNNNICSGPDDSAVN
jgi:hypothetical protein